MSSSTSENSSIERTLRTLGRAACLPSLMVACVILLSGVPDFKPLRDFLSSFSHLRPNPSLLSISISVSILLMFRESPGPFWIVRILSLLGVLMTGLTLIEYISGRDLGVSHPFFILNENPLVLGMHGKMPPNSAAVQLLHCIALYLFTFGERFARQAQSVALGSAGIAMLALMGHAYGVGNLYSITGLTAMTVLGSILFILLSFSLLIMRPNDGFIQLVTSDRAGGATARKLFLAVLFIPPVLGAISLGGHQVGSYDAPFAVSLVVIMSMIIFTAITTVLSIRLQSSDAQRERAEEELSISREELRDLSTHVQALQEEERIRIAREIHDELGQSLTALKMDVALIKASAGDGNPPSDERLNGMLALVNSTIKSVQRISTELRPGVLDDLGLTAAIEWQAQEFQRRTGIMCTLAVRPAEVTADQQRSTALFRIFQETLTNVARHSNARRVSILLERADDTLRLCVSDDGRGIEENSFVKTESLGLIGMRERALLLGGTIEIRGAAGFGTTVDVRIPLELVRDLR